MNIYINPGHGKGPTGLNDPGAIGTDGTKERDVNLGVANEMSGVTFIGKDQNMSVDEIAKAADRLPAGIFISLHCNAPIGNAQGVEVWHEHANDESRALAFRILDSILTATGQKNRGVKDEAFYSQKYLRVFHDAKGTGPSKHTAVLVEMGFLSGGDLDILKNKQKLMAQAILAPFQINLFEPEKKIISGAWESLERINDPRAREAQGHLKMANDALRKS